MFVDADFDRVLGRQGEGSELVWFSDGRDLESYYLREDCFEKIAKLSLGTKRFSGAQLLDLLIQPCKQLGFLRLDCAIHGRDLPFQKTNLRKRVSFAGDSFQLDLEGYVSALVSNAGMKGCAVQEVLNTLAQTSEQYSSLPASEIIHGHDLECFIGELLKDFKIDKAASLAVLRGTFERGLVSEYPALCEIGGFLSG